ncbi:MAG: hypothetical protein WED00_16310 [Aquisalimonadaceae bacterium]
MANLIVRNIDDRIAQALKERAMRHNRSAEAEHRAILEETLVKARKRSFSEVIASIPNVGDDKDFERKDDGHVADVFD